MMNIELRPIERTDISTINRIRNQSASYLHDDRTFTEEETHEWWLRYDLDWYAIVLDGEMIGYFRISNYSKENRNLYIGADLDEAHRGKGIGYAAYLMMMEMLFNQRKLNKITLEVLSTNERAYGLYRKLGFSVEGAKRHEVWRDGRWADSIVMSITRKEFMSLNPQSVASPCIGICQRDGDICLSCGRTMDQIRSWKDLSHGQRTDAINEMIQINVTKP